MLYSCQPSSYSAQSQAAKFNLCHVSTSLAHLLVNVLWHSKPFAKIAVVWFFFLPPIYSFILIYILYSLTFDRCEWERKKIPWKMTMAIIWSDQKCLLLWQWILIGLTFPRFSSFMIIDTWNPSLYLSNERMCMVRSSSILLVYVSIKCVRFGIWSLLSSKTSISGVELGWKWQINLIYSFRVSANGLN